MSDLAELADHHESVPDDRDTVPYVEGCEACDELRADDDPGAHQFVWLNRASTHFAADHGVKLFITKGRDYYR